MDEWNRRRQTGFKAMIGFGFASIGLVWMVCSWVGCGDSRTSEAKSQLASRLSGEWVSQDDDTVTLHFTSGTNKLVYSFTERVKLPMRSRMDPPVYTGEVRKKSDTYEIESFGDRSLKMKREPLGQVLIEFEFSSDDDFLAIYKCEWNLSPKVQGRFRRAVPRNSAPTIDTSPVAVAKQQVQRIEQKLKKVESLRSEAVKESDDMVGKLRELGVKSAADLKGNARALRMAENLAKLAAEIEGLDSQLATIDTELLKARSIVRRMEQEQAGISDDEMRQLSVQLKDAEARTDAAPTKPITPLDVDAALEAALKGRKTPTRQKN